MSTKVFPVSDPEYLRPGQVPGRFNISRSLLYEWIAEGRVKSFQVRRTGNVRGPRLVSVESIRQAIEGSRE